MKNKENIKNTFSNIRPSDECIERIFAMTVDKKTNKLAIFKRLSSTALALAILVGGGFGVNQVISKNNQPIDVDKPSAVVQSSLNPLSVMVAYAGEYKPVSEIKAGSMNEQQIFCSIHYAYTDDEKACAQAEKLYESDKANLEKACEALANEGHSSTWSSGKSTIDSVKGETTVKVYHLAGGVIALDTEDYSNVKKMTIANDSKYGELYFNYVTKKKGSGTQQIGNKVSISGEELRESHDSNLYECGTKNKVNKGYELYWNISDDLYKAIGNDLNFDLSQIKDTITFTVEFNDGTIQTASLNLYFDSDGYMHFE